MTVTHVHTDPEALTMTLTAQFEAAIGRVWKLWEDPRQLERWWGPPTYPATVVEHNMAPGGSVTYFMTGPEGDRYYGWWRVLTVEAPHGLEFEDGFADEAGNPNPKMPTTATRVILTEGTSGVTTMSIETTFPSLEAMQQLAKMGMEEGLTLAVGQIDAILAG
ncbi:MAG: SRPBCC domain-containing protein [Candidatus Limnocylindria bacterium]